MAVLTGDFAATRALMAAATLGPAAVTALARACRDGCQGGMRDSASRFAADRAVESWLAAARETAGAATVLAAQLGTMVGAGETAPEEELRHFGHELGTAIRLAEEIVDLTVDDEVEGASAGAKLQRGIYSLPVLYAIEAEPSLPRLLARHSAEGDGAEEILTTIRESSALERAIEECAGHSATARSLAEEWGGDALVTLAGAPGDYVASQLALGAVETS
jgi:heptaprenyl diphosphate synthase